MAHIHEKIDFTVAIFIVHEGKLLLIHHRKLDKWLPLGGHIELDEDPEQAALREAKEESGLDVELLGERPPTTSPGTRALLAPRFLDIHRISDTHEHIGMIYWARPKQGQVTLAAAEHHAIRWCTLADLDQLSPPMTDAVKWYCRTALAEIPRAPVNLRQQRQTLSFTIEGLNSFGTVLYFTYLYFLLHDRFGFSDKANLLVAALLGFCYTLASWQAGRLARRWGYCNALKLGFGLMAAALLVGAQLTTATGAILAAIAVTVGICFTWPVLEALVSENETPDRVPHAIGIYNITWAATSAIALFIGGTLIEKLGYGSIFYLPAIILAGQIALTFWLERLPHPVAGENREGEPHPAPRPAPARAKMFLRLAWLANPFAYIAINTLLAVLPGVAAKFHLSPMFAGFACSLWGFVRLAAFVVLWQWPGWHYRFRWLITAYLALVLSFAAILIVPNLAVVLIAQSFFGVAIGLMYYSSLFYSMDASDTKSEHGGIHEAAIGAGNCLGPAVGAMSLQFAAQTPNAGALAVSGLLLCGLGGLLLIRALTR